MNDYILRLGPRARFTLMVSVPCLLLSCFIMSPLWGAQFHPVDDHEFMAMLSLDNGSMLTRFYTRFFEMSPAGGYPESVHWRPAVWLARSVEAEILGERVSLYFLWRSILLAVLGLLAAKYGRLVDHLYRMGQVSFWRVVVIPVFFGLLTISTPSLFDVFGRLLPGEMYTLLGLLMWAYSWSHLINQRALTLRPETKYAACAWFGLVAMSLGKEDAVFLWPLAAGLSLPEIRYFASQRLKCTTWGLLVLSGLLWVGAIIQVIYTFVLRGNPLPYQSRSGSGMSEVGSTLGRIDVLSLLVVVSSAVLFLLARRWLECGYRRLALFLSAVLLLELLYVSAVPAEAPRYGAVFAVTALLLLPLYGTFIYSSFDPRIRGFKFFGRALLLILLLLIPIGTIHQREKNALHRDIAYDWNLAVLEVADLAHSLDVGQILFVVDPPGPNEIGRWEKTYSFARFVRARTNDQQNMFMTVMETTAMNTASEAMAGLEATSLRGAKDPAGYIFRPWNAFRDSRTLCVLYSDSGREFHESSRCDFVYRLSL